MKSSWPKRNSIHFSKTILKETEKFVAYFQTSLSKDFYTWSHAKLWQLLSWGKYEVDNDDYNEVDDNNNDDEDWQLVFVSTMISDKHTEHISNLRQQLVIWMLAWWQLLGNVGISQYTICTVKQVRHFLLDQVTCKLFLIRDHVDGNFLLY